MTDQLTRQTGAANFSHRSFASHSPAGSDWVQIITLLSSEQLATMLLGPLEFGPHAREASRPSDWEGRRAQERNVREEAKARALLEELQQERMIKVAAETQKSLPSCVLRFFSLFCS